MTGFRWCLHQNDLRLLALPLLCKIVVGLVLRTVRWLAVSKIRKQFRALIRYGKVLLWLKVVVDGFCLSLH